MELPLLVRHAVLQGGAVVPSIVLPDLPPLRPGGRPPDDEGEAVEELAAGPELLRETTVWALRG